MASCLPARRDRDGVTGETGSNTVLCAADQIAEGQARGFTVGSGAGRRDILVVRRSSALFGYVNSCPHTGSPLDWTPDRFMSPDGRHLMCATHGALFRIEDGYCVGGPCAGQALERVPVVDRDGCLQVVDD